jgi:hypothetical protein
MRTLRVQEIRHVADFNPRSGERLERADPTTVLRDE